MVSMAQPEWHGGPDRGVGMIYELKMYRAQTGKRDAVVKRFAVHAAPIIDRLGGKVLDAWIAQSDPDRFYYIVGFPDEDARQKVWSDFARDPEWQAVKADSEQGGPLLAEQTTELLLPAFAEGRSTE